MKFLVVNGPNINMLGIREPGIYGRDTYASLIAKIEDEAKRLGVDVECFQSNHEGALVDVIQNAYGRFDGIIINPAAYTHTSVAIPAAEIHISDVSKREDFRQISYAGMACRWHFIGEGLDGYLHAMRVMKEELQ